MVRPDTRVLAASAVVAALACAAAAFAARSLGLGAAAASAFVGAIALGYAVCAMAIAGHLSSSAESRATQRRELEDRLAHADTETDAQELLLRHVQTLLPGTAAVLLATSDSETLLTPVHDARIVTTPLGPLTTRRPAVQECLAVRDRRPHERRLDAASALDAPTPSCPLCGVLEGELACEPLIHAGRPVGSLLVAGPRIESGGRAGLRDAVRAAAPVLATHRRLAMTERRAASDPLTELPNRRAAERALRRLCAQAGRTVSPLAAVLIELDEPGLAGRRAGDAALVLVARKLVQGVRASDFLARHGDQTFVILAPDTDRLGAAELAEKLRAELERLIAPAVTSLTASIGVAALPNDALEATELMRQAGRAMATARALGGNCVREAEPTTAP